jgi:tetraacyldisaccharide 4'-kinase
MGGTGKTPLVAHIAKSLHARGINVAILTRGYGREDASANVLIKRGDSADVRTTGDEAQIFIRCCTSHVGVGTDRYAVGLAMEDRFRPDVFLLDDGFQHASLYRDFDIVAIDSLDPLAGGVFPAGTLRESFDALVRASAVVLTRTQPGRSYPGLQRMVRAENPGVPIFTSSIVPTEWRHVCTEEVLCPRAFAGKRVVAFCGLGNPGSFRRSLFDLSIGRVAWLRFPDHNRYSKADIDRIRGVADRFQAEAVLTTEKDAMHFTGSAGLLHAAYYLRIETTVEPAPSFLDSILRLITRNTGRPG